MSNIAKKDYRSEKGFDEIWESWRYLFKHDLERLDFRARQMIKEMQLECVKNPYIAEYLPVAFKALAEEVIEEQDKLYRRVRKKAVS